MRERVFIVGGFFSHKIKKKRLGKKKKVRLGIRKPQTKKEKKKQDRRNRYVLIKAKRQSKNTG